MIKVTIFILENNSPLVKEEEQTSCGISMQQVKTCDCEQHALETEKFRFSAQKKNLHGFYKMPLATIHMN